MAQLYTLKDFDHKDGLDISNINSSVQTKDGFLWLGTNNNGLLKYDGKQFHEIYFKNKDNNHQVTSLSVDSKSNVYFSSRHKGFYKLKSDGYELIYKSYRNTGEYLGIYNIKSYFLFVCENSILLSRNGKIINQKTFRSKSEKIKVTQFIEIPNGAILLTEIGNFHVSIKDQKITPLHNYLKTSEESISNYDYGFYSNQKIVLINANLDQTFEITITNEGKIISKTKKNKASPLSNSNFVTNAYFDQINKKLYFVTKEGTLFYYVNGEYSKIPLNRAEKIVQSSSLSTDLNGTIWICSNLKGLYKVSLEPFTKIDYHSTYQNSLISLIYKSNSNVIIVGTESGKTSISFNYTNFVDFDFTSFCASELKNLIYIGTPKGVKIISPSTKSVSDLAIPELANKKILFLFSDGTTLWIGASGEGLIRFDPVTKKIALSQNLYSDFPRNFYTAQKSHDGRFIYFGSSKGIHQFNVKTNTFNYINDFPTELGNISRLSTIDKYGTRWFTLNNGIVGFTKRNKKRVIQDKKKLVSTDFQTLNSDNYGNLILGTNKGISILLLDSRGVVQSVKTYGGKSGFSGYETRMNAQFQAQNSIYVGTVEGLYLINTSVLQRLPVPTKPFITRIKSRAQNSNEQNTFEFNFHINNPKIDDIQYKYRLIGLSDEWSLCSPKNSVRYSDLSDDIYTFQVRATSDKKHFSEISSTKFQVIKPFWTSNLFIIIMILVFTFLNIYLLNKIKSFDTKTIFSNKDNTITSKLIPRIILFGAIVNTVAHTIGSQIDTLIPHHFLFTVCVALLIFFVYFLSLKAVKQSNPKATKILLIIGFSITIAQNFIELYLSSLHPYFIVIITITGTLIPFIFEKLKASILYSIGVLLVSCLCFIVLDDVLFNKYLFIIIMIFTVCLSIFTTYLRHDSISKLLFISGVINKGDVVTIAFNEVDQITYCSENISHFINTTHDKIIHQHLSILAEFITLDDLARTPMENSDQFEDGNKYLVPMISLSHEIIWIEWSYKIFSKDVKVILGQDITKKMELETTFEVLVQNAEDFIYQCDASGNFVFLNDQALSRTGYDKEELIGNNTSIIVSPKFREDVAEFYRYHFLQRQDSSYHEFPIITKSGEHIWLGQHVTTLYEVGNKNRIKGFLALARDITEKRKQEQIIQEQQLNITSSIHYAKRIQINLLPHLERFDSYFQDSFVMFRPKDIVSGDFYWMEYINGRTVIALADCTGHGVPGSFMTLLGINLLNSIVLEGQLLSPASILDKLDDKLNHVLPRRQGDNKVNDGMEISICIFNHETNELTYGCAGSRFLIHQNRKFTLYKSDSKHIGDYREPDFKGYTEQTVGLHQNDTIYLFTDGFQDQFGGDKNKKFNFKRILSILEANVDQSLHNQKNTLEIEFNKWIGDFEQTDDVTIIGIKGLK